MRRVWLEILRKTAEDFFSCSPSVWRAWVEIAFMRAEVTSVKVALREEGVGRNHDVLIAWAALLVALRVEGVDRNFGSAEREKLPLRVSLNRGQSKTTAQNCL